MGDGGRCLFQATFRAPSSAVSVVTDSCTGSRRRTSVTAVQGPFPILLLARTSTVYSSWAVRLPLHLLLVFLPSRRSRGHLVVAGHRCRVTGRILAYVVAPYQVAAVVLGALPGDEHAAFAGEHLSQFG